MPDTSTEWPITAFLLILGPLQLLRAHHPLGANVGNPSVTLGPQGYLLTLWLPGNIHQLCQSTTLAVLAQAHGAAVSHGSFAVLISKCLKIFETNELWAKMPKCNVFLRHMILHTNGMWQWFQIFSTTPSSALQNQTSLTRNPIFFLATPRHVVKPWGLYKRSAERDAELKCSHVRPVCWGLREALWPNPTKFVATYLVGGFNPFQIW